MNSESISQLPSGHPDKIDHFNYLKGAGSMTIRLNEPVELTLERFIPHHR